MENRRVNVFGFNNNEVLFEGIFLKFSTQSDETEINLVALVEKLDGMVEIVIADRIQFIKEEKPVYEVFDYSGEVDNICPYRNSHGLEQFNISIGYSFCGACKHHGSNDKLNKKVTCSYKYDNK